MIQVAAAALVRRSGPRPSRRRDRAAGTVVTLLFGEAGHRVKDSGYIKLKGGTDFISVENSAITLISHGSASWTEVSRNA